MSVFPDKLESLINPPSDANLAQKWQRHREFLEEGIPIDPWGKEYEYTIDNGKVMIRSYGPDGRANSDDDITSKSTG